MRKNPSYTALLRPTRSLFPEKSATYRIKWFYTIIWQVRVVVIIEQPFRLKAFSVLFYNPFFSFLLQLQQRPPPTIQLRPRRLPSRPLRQPETDTQMPPINLRPLSSSLMNSRLNLWQLWHWLASLSQVSEKLNL